MRRKSDLTIGRPNGKTPHMNKPRLPEVIKEFAAQRKIDPARWTVKDCDQMLFVASIPTCGQAHQLAEFLSGQGMVATVVMADRTGEAWGVTAREPIPPSPGSHPHRHPRPRVRSKR